MGARRVRRVNAAAGLGYLLPSVVCAVCKQPWCRCMRDADCAWLLMVVVGSRFFCSLACGGLRWCGGLVDGTACGCRWYCGGMGTMDDGYGCGDDSG